MLRACVPCSFLGGDLEDSVTTKSRTREAMLSKLARVLPEVLREGAEQSAQQVMKAVPLLILLNMRMSSCSTMVAAYLCS